MALVLHLGRNHFPKLLVSFGLHERLIQLRPDRYQLLRLLETPLGKPIAGVDVDGDRRRTEMLVLMRRRRKELLWLLNHLKLMLELKLMKLLLLLLMKTVRIMTVHGF